MKLLESLASITINCTDKCNLKCKYCKNNKGDNVLSADIIKSVINKTPELQTNFISFSGGEPLLYPELENVIEYANKFGTYNFLLTNSTLIDYKNMESLKLKGLDCIRTTLDSVEQTKFDEIKGEGSYVKFLEGINILNTIGYGITLNIPFYEISIDDIRDIIKFAEEKNIKSIRLSPVLGKNMHGEYLKLLNSIREIYSIYSDKLKYWDLDILNSPYEFIEEVKKLECPGGIISININSNGDVTRCPHLNISFGNIYYEDIKDIWVENYDNNLNHNKTCHVVDVNLEKLFTEFINTNIDDDALNLCLSTWLFHIRDKKRVCFRDLPFWYIVLK